ncbi:hypothetical protein BBJ28_00012481 [Nothophytophthora sp. Chile5]|nr:hypothetical protein BBJ28_00012481 [Nothophytophthora sp. Chile5]
METGTAIPLGLWDNSENGTTAYQIAYFLEKNKFNTRNVDLKNEPYDATWGDGAETDWLVGAKTIGDRIMGNCSNWLGFVEGIYAEHTLTIDDTEYDFYDCLYLCNTVRPHSVGNTMTCSQIWHHMWDNGENRPTPPRIGRDIQMRLATAMEHGGDEDDAGGGAGGDEDTNQDSRGNYNE